MFFKKLKLKKKDFSKKLRGKETIEEKKRCFKTLKLKKTWYNQTTKITLYQLENIIYGT